MIIRRSRILKSNNNELGSLRSIIRSNKRSRFSESVMKAGRAHRRRTYGARDHSEDADKFYINVMRKETK